jgi:hypothetical protein
MSKIPLSKIQLCRKAKGVMRLIGRFSTSTNYAVKRRKEKEYIKVNTLLLGCKTADVRWR